jgi:hypothetical protein
VVVKGLTRRGLNVDPLAVMLKMKAATGAGGGMVKED